MEKISRQQAIASGEKLYFLGTPCKAGHVARMSVKDGCLECKASREKVLYERTKASRSERHREYRESSSEYQRTRNAEYHRKNRAAILAKQAAWRAANKSTAYENGVRWRLKNPERAKFLVAAWHAENKDRRRIISQNRRERERSGKLSHGLAARLLDLQRGKCPCCQLPLGDDYHLDHIMPLALGGTNTDDNIQLLRKRCNQQKRARNPVDFMQS